MPARISGTTADSQNPYICNLKPSGTSQGCRYNADQPSNIDAIVFGKKQEIKPSINLITDINLTPYINYLNEDKKILLAKTDYNYYEIINKHIIEKSEEIYYGLNLREYKFNIKVNLKDIIENVFHKLSYLYKKTTIKEILKKIINNINLNVNEKKIEPILNHYIIYNKNINPNSGSGED